MDAILIEAVVRAKVLLAELVSVSHAAYAAPGMMKMGSSCDSFERWRRVSGLRPYEHWCLEPACQSGPGVAPYPVLLPPNYLGSTRSRMLP
jgi:hypothetical protein